MFRINERNLISIVFTGFIAIFIIGLVLSNCYSVNTGEVAVISTFGKITRIDTEGLNFKIPFVQSKDYMETREKTYIFGKTDEMDTTMEVSTKDMQSIKLEFTVQASITDPEKLYRAFNNKHEQRFIRPRVKEIIQATTAFAFACNSFSCKEYSANLTLFSASTFNFSCSALAFSTSCSATFLLSIALSYSSLKS